MGEGDVRTNVLGSLVAFELDDPWLGSADAPTDAIWVAADSELGLAVGASVHGVILPPNAIRVKLHDEFARVST